jgi:undecaprenyl pyrophosphate phosphatase UppP
MQVSEHHENALAHIYKGRHSTRVVLTVILATLIIIVLGLLIAQNVNGN